MTEISEREPQLFTKKPVTIEAMQWDGTAESATPIIDWVLSNGGTARYDCYDHEGCPGNPEGHWIAIEALEGTMCAEPGGWVIRGVEGEFYPVKPSVFESTYEPGGLRLQSGDVVTAVSFSEDTYHRIVELASQTGRTFREMIETLVETVSEQPMVQIPDTPNKGRRFHMMRSRSHKGWRITLDGHDITKLVSRWFVEPMAGPDSPAQVNLTLMPDHVEVDQTIYAEGRPE